MKRVAKSAHASEISFDFKQKDWFLIARFLRFSSEDVVANLWVTLALEYLAEGEQVKA